MGEGKAGERSGGGHAMDIGQAAAESQASGLLYRSRVLRDTKGQGVPQERGSCRTETGCAK